MAHGPPEGKHHPTHKLTKQPPFGPKRFAQVCGDPPTNVCSMSQRRGCECPPRTRHQSPSNLAKYIALLAASLTASPTHGGQKNHAPVRTTIQPV